MACGISPFDHGAMAKKVVSRLKTKPHHFIKEWRRHRRMTQEQLGERMDRSTSWVSQLENSQIGYTQETLEALAEIFGTEPASLLMRDPTAENAVWSLVESLNAMPKEDRDRIVVMVDAFRKAS